MKTDLNPLFSPRSIAVVGASDRKESVGHIILNELRRSRAVLYPVNPKKDVILGLKVYPAVSDLPSGIDLAILALPAGPAVPAAHECGKKGIPVVIVVAGGFSEIGGEGARMEEELKKIAKLYGSRILGPNTLGVFMPENHIDTIFVEHGDRALGDGGGIAFITQSGSVGTESLGMASNIGFDLRAFVGLGNKSDLDEFDFLLWFGDDAKTKCLAFYVESLEKSRMFLEKARDIAKEKPVVILKAGRTESGSQAVSSHTGRLAGNDQVVSGAFRQYGIQRAFDDEELTDAARVLAHLRPPGGGRTALLTLAGGYGIMATDYVESISSRAGLSMAKLTDETKRRLKEISLPFASAGNPADLTASASNEDFVKALQILIEDENTDMVLPFLFFSPPLMDQEIIEPISKVIKESPKPVILFLQYGPFTDGILKQFYSRGVIGFSSVHRVVRAARFLAERGWIQKTFEEEKA